VKELGIFNVKWISLNMPLTSGMNKFRDLLLINKKVEHVQKWIVVTYGMFPKFSFSNIFKIGKFVCCTQISAPCPIHIFFRFPLREMVELVIFIFRSCNSKSS